MLQGSRVYKKPHDFKILFLYPNIQMSALVPQSMSILSAVLKREGFETKLFDCTFYKTPLSSDANEEKTYRSMVLPYDWGEKGIKPEAGDLFEDFHKTVDQYAPDLLAVGVVENTWYIADILLRSLKKRPPTLVGGVFSTYATEKVIQHPCVDWAARGEGEYTIRDLCHALADGKPTHQIPGLWAKADGQIHRNPMRPALDVNELPSPDLEIFDEKSLYRPMQGRIYRTIGIETQRGCPYTCAYCNSHSNNLLYRSEQAGRFYRKKTIKRVADELRYLHARVKPELIYFVVDTFLAMSDAELKEFADMYQDFRTRFWMNTRAETVNEWRAEQLERMNMLRMSIGIEHGNPQYRKDVLKRNVSNETTIDAFKAVAGAKFTTVANSMVGLPDETRELAFDTIELNRLLPKEIEASGAFVFTPYHGSVLRDLAVQRGYLSDDVICTLTNSGGSILNMPNFPKAEIEGLARVFSFYVKMPKDRWPEIRKAESFDDEGNAIFERLRDEFNKEFRQV